MTLIKKEICKTLDQKDQFDVYSIVTPKIKALKPFPS